MKNLARFTVIALMLIGLGLTPGYGSDDYSVEYVAIDESGGTVTGSWNPVEDLIVSDLQGTSTASVDYEIFSVLHRFAVRSSVRDWLIYE